MHAEEQLKQLKILTGNLSADELIWVQGFLAGVISGKHGIPETAKLPALPAVKKVTILYGTETGNSKSLATKFAQKAKAAHQPVKLVALDQYRPEDLAKEENVLLLISTHGDGEPPASARKFYDFIHQQNNLLSKLNYSVLALGDTAYPLFCKAGEEVDNRLSKLGATRIHALQKCDVDYESDAASWFEKAFSNFQSQGTSQATISSPSVLKKQNRKFYRGTIRSSINLNGAGSNKETYHIEIGCEESVEYQPGDSLGILPENRQDIVLQILKLTGADPNQVVQTPKVEGTIRELLTKHLNICHLSTVNLNAIAGITGHVIPDIRMDLIDILRIYPVKDATEFTEIVKILSPIAPRLYSISSAPSAHDQEVHITVSQNTFQANDELKFGLCSRFIGNLDEGEVIEFYIHQNKLFKLPALEQDLIMIGPGSGIAAMRSFLFERESTGASGRNWLFFGDQHFTTDFLYQTEIQNWLETGVLSKLSVAFSRDQQEKIYVQHKMAELKSEVYSWIEAGACLYVSGTRDPMSVDVEAALQKIIEGEGNQTSAEAKNFLNEMKEENRYLLDVY
ncbi:MAG: flavodoxin domain-containing protein [Bacteroidetes bacterium]|nr:flavodoxin domain-containing protein [Bacteroidota bacterium]